MKKIISFCVLFLFLSTVVFAVPARINYQGILKNSAGDLLIGTYAMTFSIYAATTGGAAAWQETQSVTVESGLYSVQLGGGTNVTGDLNTLFDGNIKYLGVKVGTDSEMTPRVALVSVPYAMRAATAEALTSTAPINTSGNIQTSGQFIGDGSQLTGVGDAATVDGLNASDFVRFGTTETQSTTAMYGISISQATNIGTALRIRTEGSGSTGILLRGLGASSKGIIATGESIGVWGVGLDCGGTFEGTGSDGIAVFAKSSNGVGVFGSGATYGGSFESTASGSKGIYGLSPSFGVVGKSTGTGITYGGYFEAEGTSGRAVYGTASHATGNGVGVYGDATSAGAHSGFFTGGMGLYSSSTTYGGSFEASGDSGFGVYGFSDGDNSYGVYGYVSGTTADAVYGRAGSSSRYALVGLHDAADGVALYVENLMRLVPRAAAPTTVSEGLIYINSTTNHIYAYINGGWRQLDN
ncbi:MAG: hypothetical protein HQ564_08305 [Candidatus Saganbacteria bacterium]|nr:hypothetical protein [Candidatus Saganbacteria bacterium]